jgi:tetratricopeptide (TPR) repeat protein
VQSGVKEIAQRHRSKILSPDQASSLNLVQAMQAYFDFAQRQLVQSGGSTVVAGEALYCLGKLFVLRGRTIVDGGPLDAARSIVYYQAALESDPRHYKSANELGVMMAKSGRFEYAKRLLLQSLRVHQIAQTWENLAHVHQQLGELELAQAAMFEYQQMLNDSPSSNRIKWVSPQQFVAQSPEPAELRTAQLEPGDHPSNDSSRTSGSTKAIFKRLF